MFCHYSNSKKFNKKELLPSILPKPLGQNEKEGGGKRGKQHGETDRQVTLSKLITVGQWVLHSQIQPTVNGKYSKKIIPGSSKKQNLNLPYNDTYLHSIHTVLG